MDSVIDLPFYGNLSKHVHRGYKVFNLRKGSVIKKFDTDVDKESIRGEVDSLRMVMEIDFAPSLIESHINEGWYEEEYIRGVPISACKSRDTSVLLQSFAQRIIPCLKTLMLFKNSKSVSAVEYAGMIVRTIEDSVSSSTGFDSGGSVRIINFVRSSLKHIGIRGSSSINLVFSHGDFCPANILTTAEGIRILDWESAAYRSALFDFYSYFFYRPVCIDIPLTNVFQETNQALKMFLSHTSPDASEISKNILDSEQIYRWIFYIEYVSKLVERVMTDRNLDIMEFLDQYIESFSKYEALSGNADFVGEINSACFK